MINDLLADALCRIKNGWMRKLNKVQIPNSKFVNACVKILEADGCVKAVQNVSERLLEVKLSYDQEDNPPYTQITKLSKCSLRKYVDVEDLRKLTVKQPHCLFVVSTSKGVMNAKDAIAGNIGGELLFRVN